MDHAFPAEADLTLNIRTYTEPVRQRVLAAIKRILLAESAAAGAEREPELTSITCIPVLLNDPDATAPTANALPALAGTDHTIDPGPVTGSEDFGYFATHAGAPACYWLVGGTDPGIYSKAAASGTLLRDVPSNHSALFAPAIDPTLFTGVAAMVTAALSWLSSA